MTKKQYPSLEQLKDIASALRDYLNAAHLWRDVGGEDHNLAAAHPYLAAIELVSVSETVMNPNHHPYSSLDRWHAISGWSASIGSGLIRLAGITDSLVIRYNLHKLCEGKPVESLPSLDNGKIKRPASHELDLLDRVSEVLQQEIGDSPVQVEGNGLHPKIRPDDGWPDIEEATKPVTRAELARWIDVTDKQICGMIKSKVVLAKPVSDRRWVAEVSSVTSFGHISANKISA